MSVIERLRRNDPAVTCMVIDLSDQTSDVELAQALQQNPFITDIKLYLDGVQTTDWNSLLQVIATRFNLETMKLQDAFAAENRNAPAALVSRILHAIQQNNSVQAVGLVGLHLPADVSTFVDTASSVTSFSVCNCDMEPAEQEQGTRDLAVALQRNTSIEYLDICFLDDMYAIPILQGLRSNVSLSTLAVGGDFLDATTWQIQQLLESTTTIQSFELKCALFEGDEFHPFAQSLTHSQSVSALTFYCCDFRDEGSAAQFRSILLNKQNLTALCLDRCDFSGGQVQQTVISALLRPNSQLRSYEFKDDNLSDEPPNSQFQNLLRAVKKSKLECFKIGDINSHQQLRTLTDSIPLMHVKVLKVESDINVGHENAKQLLLQAVKNNFSLQSVDCKDFGHNGFERDLFDANDKLRLAFYANRNKLLDQWADNPETVDRKVWPEALKLAEKAGPNSLFLGLRSVLGGDSTGLRVGRKRKRPQYYAPS